MTNSVTAENEIRTARNQYTTDNQDLKTIISNNGELVWNVIAKTFRKEGKVKPMNRTHFIVACAKCGYKHPTPKTRQDLQKMKTCAGCAGKPAAVKTDDAGNCISICDLGTVEFVRDYQDCHNVSEREAVRQFIARVKAHTAVDDPVVGKLTEESVRANVRRQTSKKKDRTKSEAVRPKTKQSQTELERAVERLTTSPGTAQHFMTIAVLAIESIPHDDPEFRDSVGAIVKSCRRKLDQGIKFEESSS